MAKMKNDRFTKAEKSWIFYDVANSAFTMLISTTIPLAFGLLMGMAHLSEAQQTSITSDFGLWGLTTSISVLIMAVLSPILGAHLVRFQFIIQEKYQRRNPQRHQPEFDECPEIRFY